MSNPDCEERKRPHTGGSPRAEIPTEFLAGLAKIHCSKGEAAAALGIGLSTLERHLRDDHDLRAAWEQGRAEGKLGLRRLLWEKAQQPDNAGAHVAQFLAKHWLGMTDKSLIEHGVITIEMLDREIERVQQELARRREASGASDGAAHLEVGA